MTEKLVSRREFSVALSTDANHVTMGLLKHGRVMGRAIVFILIRGVNLLFIGDVVTICL